jgi:hypothetical protein
MHLVDPLHEFVGEAGLGVPRAEARG